VEIWILSIQSMNLMALWEHFPVRRRDALESMRRRPRRGAAAAVALVLMAAVLATPAGAAGGSAKVDVLAALSARIATVKRDDGGVAVLLPATMPLQRPYYTASSASNGRYRLEIDGAEPCDGANVCLFALFTGVRGGHLYGKPIALHHGVAGRYAQIQCGAACSPPAIDWVIHGVLYTIEANPSVEDHPNVAGNVVRATFVAAADQAIDAGPR
jgi:hypothetical protein